MSAPSHPCLSDAAQVLEILATMGAAGIVRLVRELMETLVEQIANGNKVG